MQFGVLDILGVTLHIVHVSIVYLERARPNLLILYEKVHQEAEGVGARHPDACLLDVVKVLTCVLKRIVPQLEMYDQEGSMHQRVL